MPTYTIQLDDGRKVKVQADNPNAALAEANRFAASNPRNRPKREVNAFETLAESLPTVGPIFKASPKLRSMAGSGLAGATSGFTAGFADEALGMVPVVGERLKQGYRRQEKQSRERAPASFVGGQIGGAVASPVNKVAVPVRGASMGARVLAGMGSAGLQGGLTGFGTAQGGFTERLPSAAQGAVVGAGLGAASVPVAKAIEGAGTIGRRLINRFGPNIVPAEQTAARALLEQVEKFGEDRVVAEFNRLRAAGVRNPTLAEVVPGIARRVGSVARNDMDGARALARQRAGAMVGDVPILASEAAKKLSRRGGTVQTRQAQIKTRKRAIQDNMMQGIRGQSVEITPAAAGALRTSNLSRPMQAVEGNLRTQAQVTGNPALSTEANMLRSLREGEQASGGAIAPRFDPRQTQEFADQMGWADLASQRPPTPNRLPVIEAIKRMGGIKDTYVRDGLSNWRPRQRGEVERVLGRYNDIPGLINNRTGLDPADMAERLREAGYLGTGRIRRDGATAMTEGVQGGTIDDIVSLLENYRQDPDLYRYGLDEKYMDDFVTWAERQSQLDQGGLLGKANEVRARVGQNVYDNVQGPTSDDFLFEGVPSFGDEGVPRQFNVGTVESLRQQISGAEKSALANPDQAQLAASLGMVRRELVDPVRRQLPEYDQTLRVGETFNRERDAMNLATGSGNQAGMAWNNLVPAEDVANALAKMSARELRGYRQGAAQSLASKFNDGRINMSLLESLGGRGLTQERVAAQFPVNRMQALADTSNALVNRMEAARAINPNFGSQTASNLANDAMNSVEGFASLPMTRMGLVQRAITWLSENAGGLTPAERVAVVDLGTKPLTGEIADELLRIAQTAQSRQIGSPVNAMLGSNAGNQVLRAAQIGVGNQAGQAAN